MTGASTGIGWFAVPLAIVAGAFRGGTPFLFVSLGECLTEKSGKINLGLEGVLLFGAMSAYAISYKTGSPWLGVLAAACGGACLGLIHAWLTQKPKVNDIAVGIAMIIFGSGIAFFLGKPFIQPLAPQLPTIKIGLGEHIPSARHLSSLFRRSRAGFCSPLVFWRDPLGNVRARCR